MALFFNAHNDKAIRKQILKRFHSYGFILEANLKSFDYEFVEYSNDNADYYGLNNTYSIGDGQDFKQFYLGDVQYQSRRLQSEFGLYLFNRDLIKHDFLSSSYYLTWNYINNVLFQKLAYTQGRQSKCYWTFVGVKITIR